MYIERKIYVVATLLLPFVILSADPPQKYLQESGFRLLAGFVCICLAFGESRGFVQITKALLSKGFLSSSCFFCIVVGFVFRCSGSLSFCLHVRPSLLARFRGNCEIAWLSLVVPNCSSFLKS